MVYTAHKCRNKKKDLTMNRFLPTAVLVSTFTLSAALFSAPAHAERITSEPVTLKYDRLALQAQTGANTVLSDLQRQARKACMSVDPVLRTQFVDDVCVSDILEQAVSKIDDPALTSAYERTGGLALRLTDGDTDQG